jgi:dUTP pyrophosphatase
MFEWINSSIKNYIISIVEKEFFESDDDKLKIQKLNNNAIIPIKATKLAAGYDLYSIDAITIPPQSRVVVNTGLSIKTPDGTYGRIAPRSGMALNGIDVGGGVIDQDYTGPLKIILINNNENEFKIVEGMKIAQLVCEKICYPEIQLVDKFEQTERGSNGFGSTGTILHPSFWTPTTEINGRTGNPWRFRDQKTQAIFEFTNEMKPKSVEKTFEFTNELKKSVEKTPVVEKTFEFTNELKKSVEKTPVVEKTFEFTNELKKSVENTFVKEVKKEK